jgi:putative endonuclease
MTMGDWSVYIVQCCDGSYYCGASNNVPKRVATHNKGKGAKYTKKRLPVVLIAQRDGLDKIEALKFEYKVKHQPKKNKIAFLTGQQ